MSRCVKPQARWLSIDPNRHGYHYPVRDPDKGQPGSFHYVDCRKCVGCAARNALDWSVRAFMEAHETEHNCVVNLTFAQEPESCQEAAPVVSGFLKRLRTRNARSGGPKVRFFGVVERGMQRDRVHAHVIVFGQDFRDTMHSRGFRNGREFYRSHLLDELWSSGRYCLGWHDVMPATPAAIFYAAGDALKNFERESKPLFSTRPLLGKAFMDRYADDFARVGGIHIDGKVCPLPRQFNRRKEYADVLAPLKARAREFVDARTFDDLERHAATAESREINMRDTLKRRRGEC